jgi:hypothetical protein
LACRNSDSEYDHDGRAGFTAWHLEIEFEQQHESSETIEHRQHSLAWVKVGCKSNDRLIECIAGSDEIVAAFIAVVQVTDEVVGSLQVIDSPSADTAWLGS